MYPFTVQDARNLQNNTDSHTSRGQIIDGIRAAIKQGQSELSLDGMNPSDETLGQFVSDGFVLNNNNLSWSEE